METEACACGSWNLCAMPREACPPTGVLTGLKPQAPAAVQAGGLQHVLKKPSDLLSLRLARKQHAYSEPMSVMWL